MALAEEWATALGPEKAQLLMMTDTVLAVLNGTFRSEIVILFWLMALGVLMWRNVNRLSRAAADAGVRT